MSSAPPALIPGGWGAGTGAGVGGPPSQRQQDTEAWETEGAMGKRQRDRCRRPRDRERQWASRTKSEMGDVNSETGRRRARDRLRDKAVPQHPHPLPQTQQTRAAPSLPPGLCQAPDNAPLSWLQSRQLEGRLGPGGRDSHQEAELWPLPSDSAFSSWPPFLVPTCSQHVWSACCVCLKCPLASPGALLSPVPSCALCLFFLCFWLRSLEEIGIY